MKGVRRDPRHHAGMDRRRFLRTSVAGALAAPLAAEAQSAGKVYRVGVLTRGQRVRGQADEAVAEGEGARADRCEERWRRRISAPGPSN